MTEPDLVEAERVLRERQAELRERIAGLARPPERGALLGFGKRIGDGTTEAISRLTDVGVGTSLEVSEERISRALAKLEEGTYGVCDACGGPIAPGRLRRRPRERALHRVRAPGAVIRKGRGAAPTDTGSPPERVWPLHIGRHPPRCDIAPMTATDARNRLHRLQAERLDAVEAGLGDNALYMTDLENDIAQSHAAYVGLAITEIATLRGQLGAPQVG